jgi:hypothetical protein
VAVTHAGGKRWILVGPRAAATSSIPNVRASPRPSPPGRARELAARTLCWEAAAPRHRRARRRRSVEGTLLAAYEYRAYKTGGDGPGPARRLDTLLVTAHDDVGRARARRRTIASRRQRGARPAEHAVQRPDARRAWPTRRAPSPRATAR